MREPRPDSELFCSRRSAFSAFSADAPLRMVETVSLRASITRAWRQQIERNPSSSQGALASWASDGGRPFVGTVWYGCIEPPPRTPSRLGLPAPTEEYPARECAEIASARPASTERTEPRQESLARHHTARLTRQRTQTRASRRYFRQMGDHLKGRLLRHPWLCAANAPDLLTGRRAAARFSSEPAGARMGGRLQMDHSAE